MLRVCLCEQWNEDKRYWSLAFVTDSQEAADRWRRNGEGRKWSDYIVQTKEQIESSISENKR